MDRTTRNILEFCEGVKNTLKGISNNDDYNRVIYFLADQVIDSFKGINILIENNLYNSGFSLYRSVIEAIVNFWYIHTDVLALVDRFVKFVPYVKYEYADHMTNKVKSTKKWSTIKSENSKGHEIFKDYENHNKNDWSGLFFHEKVEAVFKSKKVKLSQPFKNIIAEWKFYSLYTHSNPVIMDFNSQGCKILDKYFLEMSEVFLFLFFNDIKCLLEFKTFIDEKVNDIMRMIKNKYTDSLIGYEFQPLTQVLKVASHSNP